MKVFVFGTLKRGFALHHGLAGARFLGEYRTVERFPMLIAGPWYAPMIFNEPGVGHSGLGGGYEMGEGHLAGLAEMDAAGKPGNFRFLINCAPWWAQRPWPRLR